MRAIGVMLIVGMLATPAYAETDAERADKLFVEGRDLLKAGKAQAACDKFHAANALNTTAPSVMLNLGLCYEALGKIATSLKWYRRAQTAASEAKPQATEFEEHAKEKKKDLAAKVATIKVDLAATQAEVEIRIDGERIGRTDLVSPIEVDKGAHKLEASAVGLAPFSQDITIEDGQQKAIPVPALEKEVVVITPATPKGGHKKLGYGLVFGSAPFLIGIPIIAYVIQQDYKDDKKPGYAPDLFVGMGIAWTVAAVAAAGGVYFIVSSPKQERRTAVVPVVTPDHAGVAVLGRF